MPDPDAVIAAIGAARMIPVVRTGTAQASLDQAGRLLDAGQRVIELTATTPGWAEVLAELRRGRPSVLLGVGTVTEAGSAERALDGGADFLVSPYPAPGVRRIAAHWGALLIEGGFTPAEVAAASAQGIAKLFPASVLGPTYLRALLSVLPGRRIVPTGGIRLGDVAEWLGVGAFAVGVGSDLASADADTLAALEAVISSRSS